MGDRSRDQLHPLSYQQERLFLLDRIMPGVGAYNVPTLVRVGGHLDEAWLRQAFTTVVARHEILRTRFVLADGTPRQEILAAQPFELVVADLRALPGVTAQRRAEALLAELANRPFDLTGEVLLRAALVHLPGDEDRLLTVFHHMGSDHVSSGLLFAELDAIYSALAAGEEPALADLPIQYADFARRQAERLRGERLQELLEHWTETLAGAPARLDVPSDRPRPSQPSYRGGRLATVLSPELARSLRDLARREGASVFMVLVAAFKTLLLRYSGASDVVVGVPVSGRHEEDIAKLLGYFSNTVALRTDLSGDPTFTDVLARVRAATLGALTHQELPFERLVQALNPDRTQSYSPVFQVLFAYDVAPKHEPRLAGHALERLAVPGWEWSRFDLECVVRETSDGALRADLVYAADLFEAATARRLLGHFETLLNAVAARPETRLSALPLLTEGERRQLLGEWVDTAQPFDCRCLHELFSEQAARNPEAIAVVAGPSRMSYGELEAASNRLARELAQRGIGPGAFVGICLDRSVELVSAMLAALKSGAAYVPIEPSYPPHRQEFMLADAGAALLITQERHLGVVSLASEATLCLDRFADRRRIGEHADGPLEPLAGPDDLAYVIYTSGSTGQPKGVEIRHRSVANLVAEMRRRPGLTDGDVVANITTPAFDLSVPDWYLPLSSGARLVIVPREATTDGVELAGWLARSGATFVQATPTTWQLLVDSGWKGSPTLTIVCGGEPLGAGLANELVIRGASLWHMYGPTETTVWSSILALEPGDGPPPLGGPIANTAFYLVDDHAQPVPIGIPGELWIGGEGVANGYHHRSELTAEKFVANPFGGHPRLYRTGDIMRWRANRTLEFLGRRDEQVKLRGFRIELGEVEAVLHAHPDIGGAVALVREDSPGDARLVAYVTATDARPLDVESLRRLLRAQLPHFMVPSAIVVLDALPVSANGKLDRRALPAPDGARSLLAGTYTPPDTPIQETLAAVWAEVLGLERVGIEDNFFDLGGHSLLAVRMLARVQEAFGLEIPLGRVFDSATIRDLATVITEALVLESGDELLTALLSEG